MRNLRITNPQKSLNVVHSNLGYRYFNQVRRRTRTQLKRDYDERFTNYLMALAHPDYVVSSRIIAKQPTPLEIPSSTISFKEVYTATPNTSGRIAFQWTPNFLNTSSSYKYCHLYMINGNSFTESAVNGEVTLLYSFSPNVPIRGYRLVSAQMDISYIGAPIERAGTLYSCVDYSLASVYIGSREAQLTLPWPKDSEIRNGIWATTTSISSGQKLTALYLPSDPSDQIFYPSGSFYGNEIVNEINEGGKLITGDEGARISYLVIGTGLAAKADSIKIELYYNFEVLPTPISAPILKSEGNTFSTQQTNLAQQFVSKMNMQNPISSLPAKFKFDPVKTSEAVKKAISFGSNAYKFVKLLSFSL